MFLRTTTDKVKTSRRPTGLASFGREGERIRRQMAVAKAGKPRLCIGGNQFSLPWKFAFGRHLVLLIKSPTTRKDGRILWVQLGRHRIFPKIYRQGELRADVVVWNSTEICLNLVSALTDSRQLGN